MQILVQYTKKTVHKKNYRPVSILPLASKIYERVIYEQNQINLKLYSINCVVFEKHTVHSMLCLNYGLHGKSPLIKKYLVVIF